jgi:hypothetical protein
MKYFETLPKVVYTDQKKNSKVYTNLLARVSVKPTLLDNSVIYYKYDIQDGDTPEIIAHKYYGDVYRYWIVLYVNQILDPQWGWPVTSNAFEDYVRNKYPNMSYYVIPHHFEKIITQVDSKTNITTTNILIVDEFTYDNLPPEPITKSFSFASGTTTVTTSRRVVSLYDYEMDLNESKRNIKILNSAYVNQFETEFSDLMAA